MKRSSQVALVLMGVTGVTAAGAYMMPARSADCRPPNQQQQQTAQRVGPEIGGEAPKARVAQDDGCRRRRSSWGNWSWNSGSSSSGDRWRSRPNRSPNSVSTAFSPGRSSGTSSGTTTSRPNPTTSSRSWSGSSSSSTSSASRGGFGSTSRGFSSSGS